MLSKRILVTGGNRSLGLGIVQAILQLSTDQTIIIASRDKTNAEQAITELKGKGFQASMYPLTLDVTDDESIRAAVAEVDNKFGKLDVLINNAGIAKLDHDLSTARATWAEVMDVNVTSVRILSEMFLPLLQKADDPRVINISSARGSFDRVLNGKDPSNFAAPYSSSKACLNFLTLLVGREHPDVTYYAVSPGHCKTALNGFRGSKDPVDGGKPAAELALAEKGRFKAGFWECEESGMEEIGW